MAGRNGNESFDFSQPFSKEAVDVEVVPKKQDDVQVDPVGTFADRFEAAKHDTPIMSNTSVQRVNSGSGGVTWGLTLVLLLLFCGLSTYALIHYRSNQESLADARRQQSVAGVRANVPVRIVGDGFSVITERVLSKDFVYSNTGTKSIEGVDRLFSRSSVVIKKDNKQSGLIILQQELTQPLQESAVNTLIDTIANSVNTVRTAGATQNKDGVIEWTSNQLASSPQQIKVIIGTKNVMIVELFDEVAGYSQDVTAMFAGIAPNR